jgi:sporulation protein YlmC with PRC-barrel domain
VYLAGDTALAARIGEPGRWDSELERVGTLSRVLVEDATDEVEEVVVRLDEGLEEALGEVREVRVPLERVVAATEERVVVDFSSREALEARSEYLEERPPRPADRWVPPPRYTITDLLGRLALLLGGGANVPGLVEEHEKPAGEHQIVFHAPLLLDGERVGEITRVLYDANGGQVRALVLRRRHDDEQEWVLPAEYVAAVADDAVELSASRAQLTALERFRP